MSKVGQRGCPRRKSLNTNLSNSNMSRDLKTPFFCLPWNKLGTLLDFVKLSETSKWRHHQYRAQPFTDSLCCIHWEFLEDDPDLSMPSVFFLFYGFYLFWLYWIFPVAQVLPCSTSLSCPAACGILAPWPGIEPGSPALQGRFLTTGPPGKSHVLSGFWESQLKGLSGWWRESLHLLSALKFLKGKEKVKLLTLLFTAIMIGDFTWENVVTFFFYFLFFLFVAKVDHFRYSPDSF